MRTQIILIRTIKTLLKVNGATTRLEQSVQARLGTMCYVTSLFVFIVFSYSSDFDLAHIRGVDAYASEKTY